MPNRSLSSEYFVVDSVKRRAEVQQRKSWHETCVRRSYDIVVDADDGGLGRVALSIGWLAHWKNTVLVGVSSQTLYYQPLNGFRYEAEVGNWSVWRYVSWVSGRLFESRTDYRVFVFVWKVTLCKRCVGHCCDDWWERITQLLDQPRWYRVEFILLVVDIADNTRHFLDCRAIETGKRWNVPAVSGRAQAMVIRIASTLPVKYRLISFEEWGTNTDETGWSNVLIFCQSDLESGRLSIVLEDACSSWKTVNRTGRALHDSRPRDLSGGIAV